ncbi:MAG TPA: SDR family NAD(P)-dependent oxidoreductase [Acidimicrobiales bacterium]|nr:SDR family NAD(P)-dependent oxidoreductase [Acidimicrobiales bacterium]
MAFDATTTTDEVMAGVDLSRKTALVTGASAGLGVETTRVLAAAGAEVVMAVRDKAKGEAAIETIRASAPDAPLELAELDLASLDSVRGFAASVLERHPRIDLLINNAGVMAPPLQRTAEGFELQMGTNHLGHFLLTNLLTPAVVAAAPARVINLSSRGHFRSDIRWDDPHWRTTEYDKWEGYGQSKTANILFSLELDGRLRDQGVRAFAVHPGVIMTELSRHLTRDDVGTLRSRSPGGRLEFKTTEQGAATTVWGATSPDLDGKGGLYLDDCQIGEPAPYALDPESAARLWSWSEGEVGL